MITTTIKLMDIVQGTSTNMDALPLFQKLDELLQEGALIRISLERLTPLSTSFLHSSFGELVEKHGYNKVRASIILTHFRMSDAQKIKTYLQDIAALKERL